MCKIENFDHGGKGMVLKSRADFRTATPQLAGLTEIARSQPRPVVFEHVASSKGEVWRHDHAGSRGIWGLAAKVRDDLEGNFRDW